MTQRSPEFVASIIESAFRRGITAPALYHSLVSLGFSGEEMGLGLLHFLKQEELRNAEETPTMDCQAAQ